MLPTIEVKSRISNCVTEGLWHPLFLKIKSFIYVITLDNP